MLMHSEVIHRSSTTTGTSSGTSLVRSRPTRRVVARTTLRGHVGHDHSPDSYGHWHEGRAEVQFFLEYDRGTEPLDRVVAKLDGYADLITATGITTPVPFWLPGPRREAALRRLLHPSSVPIATAHPLASRTPADAIWLRHDTTHEGRTRLASVAQ